MPTLADIRRAAIDAAAAFGLSKVTLFGSYARGDADDTSDIDLVVEPSRPLGLARASLYRQLEQALGRSVDVVFGARNLYPFVRESFDAEGVVLYEAR